MNYRIFPAKIVLGLVLLAVLLLVAWAVWRRSSPTSAEVAGSLSERLEPHFGYAGSDSCQECHSHEYHSWHDSYHRTMTQLPTPETVQAPFDGVTLERFGWEYHLEQRGDEFWIDMVDPDWERAQFARGDLKRYYVKNPPRVRKPIVMVTGSHHKQAFWVESSTREFLCRIPWSYRIDDQRWIPLEDDYLAPPDAGPSLGIWNDNCIQCHAVAGQPRRRAPKTPPNQTQPDLTPFDFESRVAELGIACEACHGPGAGHVARYRAQAKDAKSSAKPNSKLRQIPLDRIVNPAKLSHQRASQICGQCHVTSVIKDHPQFMRFGFPFRPGDDLHETMYFLKYTEQPQEPWLAKVAQDNPSMLQNRFWKDGAVRVTGREFNGLLESPCFQKGEMSCLSCHSMHNYQAPSDQLAEGAHTNAACTQCHQEYQGRWQEHTHHAKGSSGDQCINCHMPHTTYGLFKAIHSHRIDSPSVASDVATGRPNACNLCHLDQTHAWTADYLTRWYGAPAVDLRPENREVAASILWMLRGDAAQRAILAWHLGWAPAKQAAGLAPRAASGHASGARRLDWMAPYLARLLDDPYSAVRNVAGRSLKRLSGYEDIPFDFLADKKEREKVSQKVVSRWSSRAKANAGAKKASGRQDNQRLLLGEGGTLVQEKIDWLENQRDDRRVHIAE